MLKVGLASSTAILRGRGQDWTMVGSRPSGKVEGD